MLTEKTRAGEFLISEMPGTISRDTVVIPAGAAIEPGTLLGVVTASTKSVAYSNAASDGSQTVKSILYRGVPESTGDREGVVVNFGAEVAAAALIGLDTPARADLAALFIKVRD